MHSPVFRLIVATLLLATFAAGLCPGCPPKSEHDCCPDTQKPLPFDCPRLQGAAEPQSVTLVAVTPLAAEAVQQPLAAPVEQPSVEFQAPPTLNRLSLLSTLRC